MKTLFSFGCLILMLGIFVTCSTDDTPVVENTDPIITDIGTPAGNPVSVLIGTSGGTLQSEDGKLSIIIPAGALSSSTTISIQPITNEGPLGLGLGYRLQPEGITFANPIALQFHYDEQLLDETLEDFLWIITQASNGTWNAMLKSVVDVNAKTVTIETTHFSDWALGKFIELSLNPSSKTILKGQSVNLQVAGFSRDKTVQDDDELAPLIPITNTDDALTPLTPIPPIESRLMDFKIKSWTLNGASAPVSNSNGSLQAETNSATYTAPNQKPSPNPVAVSVSLESNNKEGKKASYILTSSISVVESNLYVLLKIDGQTLEYYQYGFNGSIPPDPNNISIANCGLDGNILSIAASQVQNSTNLVTGFGLVLKNPSVGTNTLSCFYNDGEDDLAFGFGQEKGYSISYVKRTKLQNDICDLEYLCGDVSVTLLSYTGASLSDVRGYFSGTIYEEKPEFGTQCKSAVEHPIEGEFWLIQAN